MELLGFIITRKKSSANAAPVTENRGGWFRIYESFTGAWQQNVTVDRNTIITYHAIYSCATLIASDIAKLCMRLVAKDEYGIWIEAENPAYSPVLRKPNHYQTRIQFWESWILSKLIRGNTYVLKDRDARGVVSALYVLDPCRVTPMVADDGSIFYRLAADNMSGLKQDVMVPASEIIHDRWNCFFHPLVGTSPLVACGVAAMQGIAIQNNQTNYFNNASMPGGILTAPGHIADDSATFLKTQWETNYGGTNAGKIAVMGDGLKFEKIAFTSVELQMIDQLKWTAEVACSVFHVPGYKVGVGDVPPNTSVQSLNLEYYSQALQRLIEDAEVCMDEGLNTGTSLGTEFDVDNLLRMDSLTLLQSMKEGVSAGVYAPNEARRRVNLGPVTGGETPYLQQQNFSLAALAKRDAQDDPFKTSAPAKQEPLALPPPDANAAKSISIIASRRRFDGNFTREKAA